MHSGAGGNGVKKSKVQNILKHILISKILKSDRIFWEETVGFMQNSVEVISINRIYSKTCREGRESSGLKYPYTRNANHFYQKNSLS